MRGERSDGMILSEQELDLGQDHAGIIVLSEPAEPGTPLVDLFAVGEQVLEVEVTGNRPDLLSVYGLAREVAALYGLELAPPPGGEPARAGDEPVDIRIEDPRRLSRLHRPSLPGRADRSVPAVAEGAARRGRHATDLERRRRDELRDARARKPAARVRPREAVRGADRRSAAPPRARRSRRSTAICAGSSRPTS